MNYYNNIREILTNNEINKNVKDYSKNKVELESYYMTNPYIGLMMRIFGIMKCNMILPIDLMIITILFIIGISLIGTILMSLKIRKIQPVNLLTGE